MGNTAVLDPAARRQEALRLIDEGNAIEDAGQLTIAMQRYDAAIALAPDLARGHVNRGNVLLAQGDAEGALAAYALAVANEPDYVGAHFNSGNACARLGRHEAALAAYGRALALKPDFAAAETAIGCVLEDLGRLDEAESRYRRSLAINAVSAETHFNLAGVLGRLGRLHEAASSYRDAVALRPDFAEAHYLLADCMAALGQLDDAVRSYTNATTSKPEFAEAHYGLGNALTRLGRIEEGLASHRRAVDARPDFAEAHNNVGAALRELGRFEEAAASFQRALQIRPAFAEALSNLGNVFDALLRPAEAEASYRKAIEASPSFVPAYHNLLFCLSEHECWDADALFEEHRRFAERFEEPLRAGWPRHGNDRDPDRLLQIGFVSADFRDHAVAHFVEPVFAHLARRPGAALSLYYNHASDDRVTQRLRVFAKHWHPVAAMSDEALAAKIAADGIDILVDLSGHTAGNRLLTFARKPAPVQASWIGYPGTTGLEAMDYYLADRYLFPPGRFDSRFTEKLAYLPVNAPFLPYEGAPPVNPLPALRNGRITFGSFNRLSKLSATAVALWADLLRALPDARMVLGGMPRDGNYGPLLGWFTREGVDPVRLEFHPRCDTVSYLALHHRVDICVDTFPYTGGTTTNHALWMGVPTLTLAGSTPPSRQGAAVLGRAGLDAFVAADAADFRAKGLRWARDTAALAELRAGLRERCARSPTRRPDLIAESLERAFRTMWRRWCAGEPPATFSVESTT